MKKFIALVLALALALVLALSVTAFAETITTSGGEASASVYATYVEGSAVATVYSVDISWGSMEFTYTDASAGTWDGDSHEYTDTADAAWSYVAGANVITVTNHSNTAITADLAYNQASGYEDITGIFDQNSLNLATAVETTPDAAPAASAALTLSGTLSDTATEKVSVGTVVITISGVTA